MSEVNLTHGAVARGHETTDADVSKLTLFGLILAAMILAGFIVTEAVFHYVIKSENTQRQVAPFENQSQIPPEPHLQVSSSTDLETYRKQQTETLDSYGWVDPKHTVVHIPIDQAMDIMLQKGFPARKAGEVTPGVSTPFEIPRGDFAPPPVGVKGPQKQ
ncbi:MAG: hypothetical protein ACRD3T_02800 [Terriglobia bacterium]